MFAATAAASLAACDDMEMTEMSDTPTGGGNGIVENACITAVNTNMTGGSATVLSSDFSEAGIVVTLRSRDGTNWRCLASNNGIVEDLSIV